MAIMLAKLEQAKANNEILKVSYTTVVFSGSSGVGKTSLVNKLNKEQVNRHHHSTGVAKSKHTICIKTAAVVKSTEGLQWVDLDHDSMISYLNKHLHGLKLPSSSLHAISSQLQRYNILDKKAYKKSLPLLSAGVASSPQANIPNTASSTKSNKAEVNIAKPDLVAVDIAKVNSSNTPSLGDVWDVINFLDTGGQPEFVNILPAVSSSIALTFIVFNLRKSLDDLVRVEHNVKGDPSFKPYDLDCTNVEFIKRLMVSSENFNKTNNPVGLKSIQRKDGKSDCKVCFVGTHALNVRKEKIQEIDDKLSSVAGELELQQRSFWSSPKPQLKRLFPVDMFPGNKKKESFDDVIEDIRDNIQKQVESRDYYEVPITWFIFLLKIQKLCNMSKVSYISYQEAVDVWMDKDVSKATQLDQGLHEEQHEKVSRENSDVHNILLFFHFMGMLFYYHEVKGICDFVFIDRQWLFEKLTELVEIKFTKGYSKKDVSAEDVEKFTMEGRLSINIIQNLQINLQGIQPLYFIHLLDHLNIVAPIDSKGEEYFMPSVLPSFPATKSVHKFSNLDKLYGTIQHMPLLVGFKSGPMPHGFFCNLIVELLRNLPIDWHVPLLSTSRIQHVYNNLITFPTVSGHAITLIYKIGYIEVQVRHKQSQHSIIHCNVQRELDEALRKVSDHLQLNKEQLCYGFYCDCEGIQHFAKLKDLMSPSEYIKCCYGIAKLTEEHRVWLQESKQQYGGPQQGITETASQQDVKLPDCTLLLAQEVQMFELTQIVIPKIKAEWETLAYCMRYTPEEVNGFREDDSGECCKNLFANWISTGHGPSPKTYQTLLKHIKKIGKLTTASVAVSKELIEAFEVSQQDVQLPDHASLLAKEAQMFELTEIVVPKIKAEWESLAYCMRYTPEEVNGFRKDSQDCGERCKNLFTNWISTGHDPKPKTYQTLLKHIKKIDKLTAAYETVAEELIKALQDQDQ